MANKKYDLLSLRADRDEWIDIPDIVINEKYRYSQKNIKYRNRAEIYTKNLMQIVS